MDQTPEEGFIIQNRTGFERLFRAYYSVLCGYANSFLQDPAAAEEIVQDVMIKIWINRETIKITTSYRSYLFRAVRNGCMNLLRHLKVKEEYKIWSKAMGDDFERSQEDHLIVSELEQKIRESIDKLPFERRKVFILSRYENLTYSEIGVKLGISIKTVENQMGKALRTLREELAEYLPWLILFFFELFRDCW